MGPAPSSYVGGSLTLTAGVVSNLLQLIQTQLDPNCPTSALELQLTADASNAGAISVGQYSKLQGALSATNFAYKLVPTSPPRIYRSSYPGTSTPLGDLQVMAAGDAILHVEVST